MRERPINIVLVENDHFFVEFAERDFSNLQIIAEVLSTEHQFRERLPFWRVNPPEVFVLGSWVRWTDPSPDMPEPTQDVIDEGYHRAAGLRMQKILRKEPKLQDAAVIIWGFESDDQRFSRENRSNLPPGVIFEEKGELEKRRLGWTVRSLAMALR